MAHAAARELTISCSHRNRGEKLWRPRMRGVFSIWTKMAGASVTDGLPKFIEECDVAKPKLAARYALAEFPPCDGHAVDVEFIG
jgi:hypothetical protein